MLQFSYLNLSLKAKQHAMATVTGNYHHMPAIIDTRASQKYSNFFVGSLVTHGGDQISGFGPTHTTFFFYGARSTDFDYVVNLHFCPRA